MDDAEILSLLKDHGRLESDLEVMDEIQLSMKYAAEFQAYQVLWNIQTTTHRRHCYLGFRKFLLDVGVKTHSNQQIFIARSGQIRWAVA